jgi:hypothetical protein
MLGALDALDGCPPGRRLRVSSPSGRVVVAEPRRPNHVVPRAVFDARLVAAAQQRTSRCAGTGSAGW